jgi:Family of unknown function (DUF6535)
METAWEYYNELASTLDKERISDWTDQMDAVLVFVSLSPEVISLS